MLTVAIASGDPASSAQLLACLQQTGLVKSVKQWAVPADKLPDPADSTGKREPCHSADVVNFICIAFHTSSVISLAS